MIIYLTLLVIALSSTYLAFYRYEIHVELPLLVALTSWAFLVVESAEIAMISGGDTILVTSRAIQVISLFMALITAFALVGAVFDVFPTEKMHDAKQNET